jgi:ribosome biogenesis GTPase
MDEHDKAKQWQRYLRAARHWIDREEEQRRKLDARRRRAERGRDAPRRRDVDDEETFARIRRKGARGGRAAGPTPVDLAGTARAVVTALHRGSVLLDGGKPARIAGPLVADPDFDLAVGDEVLVRDCDGPARIEARLPRRSVLARPDPGHPRSELVLAANVDVAVVVVAVADPPLRPGLIDRVLLALGRGGVAPAICVNKVDLLADAGEHEEVAAALAPYVDLGVPVFPCSAAAGLGIGELRAHLTGRTCVFVGHSGVGKSSVLNALDPDGARTVGRVRDDGKGRHTTTASCLRVLADGTRVIDTPGVRAFGLLALDRAALAAGFPEFAPFSSACRHRDCSHVHEPKCAVRAAAERGAVPAARFASYLRIMEGGADRDG